MRVLAAKKVFLGDGSFRENLSIFLDEQGFIVSLRDGITENAERYDALCPGLINAHCHTELSHLRGRIPEGTGLPGFIDAVQAIRKAEIDEQIQAQADALAEMESKGIVGLGDICNSALGLEAKQHSSIISYNFIELFGFTPQMAEAVYSAGLERLKAFQTKNLAANIVPHAPYSVSLELLETIVNHNQGLLSIHMQECDAEDELFIYKTGKLKEQLERFGLDLSSWKNPGISSLQSFLPQLQKHRLILVHNTRSAAEDIAQAKEKGAYFCTCPKANLYIEQQVPDYALFEDCQDQMLIGTDSLASNHALSIWDEMECIATHYPKLDLPQLLKWACQNASEAFNWNHLGKLEVGKKPGVLALKEDSSKALGYVFIKPLI